MSFPAYLHYKKCDVTGIDVIPSAWTVMRMKQAGKLQGGSGFPHHEQGAKGEELVFYKVADLALSPDGLTMGSGNHSISQQTATCLRAAVIPKGSIVYAKIGAALLLNRRRMTSAECCIDNNMTAFTPYKSILCSQFAWYWLQTVDFGTMVNPGAVPSLSEGDQSILRLPIPPLADQHAIAAFLDRETATIDALVAEQERLIALLNEKRQAVISHAVTKSLNLDIPMKETARSWIGFVPLHWDVMPLKYVSRIGNGSTPNRDNPAYWDGGTYPWLSSTHVNRKFVDDSSEFVTKIALEECHLPRVNPKAVLVGITGQGKTRGMASLLLIEATVNQHIAFVKTDEKFLLPEFLLRLLGHLYQFLRLESEGAGSTKGAITCEQLANLTIPLPSIEEQASIITFLEAESCRIDSLILEAERAVALLDERRAALISAAVTGKIDVRGLVETTIPVQAAAA